MGKWLVYLHKNQTTGVVFYVGIGSRKNRPLSTKRNNFWKHYVNKHGAPTVEIVASGITEEKAKAMEVKLIASYGHRSKGGTLVNITSGGDDQPMRHQHVRDKVSRAMKKRICSPETRKKMSDSAKKRGMGHISATARRIRMFRNNPMRSAVSRARLSRSLKGRVFSEEHRRRNGASHSKPVAQWTLTGEFVAVHASQRAAGLVMNCTAENIGTAIKNKCTAKGFKWTRATRKSENRNPPRS